MKLCKNCKHVDHGFAMNAHCARSVRVKRIDMRDGREVRGGWKQTSDEREPGRIMARLTGSCGKEGRFWEKKA